MNFNLLYSLPDNTDLIKCFSVQDAWEKLLESERFDQADDFAVIFQPSLQARNLLLGPVSKLALLHPFWIVSPETDCSTPLALSCLGCG